MTGMRACGTSQTLEKNMLSGNRLWLVCLFVTLGNAGTAAVVYPGPEPGPAVSDMPENAVTLRNGAVSATWQFDGGLRLGAFASAAESAEHAAANGEVFVISLTGGGVIKASDCTLRERPWTEKITGCADARRGADRRDGVRVGATLVSPDQAFTAAWEADLRDDSNYVIQRVTFAPSAGVLPVEAVRLIDLDAQGAQVCGATQGAPVVAGLLFFALEHPMSESAVAENRITCSLRRGQALAAGKSLTLSSVMGAVPPGQLRRGFLHYIERERAHPYHPFLHYNSWYDIAWAGRKFNEAEALAAIETFARELTGQRDVKMDCFVFDDGWDDNTTLWQFHGGFPNGFGPLRDAAARSGAAVGTWLSPFGGYGAAREQRIKCAMAQGFEVNRNGFSLSGPRYYARFHDICAEMVREYGVNFFKFDGMGPGNDKTGGEEFLEDIEALMRLAGDLREQAPDLYISATTGTWCTPYFLWHADSTWRSASDMGFSGKGTKRQQWINYRDTHTYRNVVRQGPLYPLNSLMTQGIVHARYGPSALMGEDPRDFADEVWSFFGSGTSLQDLYIAPQLMTDAMWNTLAAGARWSRANGDVLLDTHWVGGDPGEHQVYGWASWTPRKGILVLRNPDDQPASITLDLQDAFELPPGAPREYRLASPGPGTKDTPPLNASAGAPRAFLLEPFQTVVYDAQPVR
ncbi:MAG: enterotoxin [Candidatus Hydrogenedentes bacterium]|nr:enterotoxin [Candidatus Hydrogenedentota bacterium]